jgi:hypothetical protein
MKYIIINNFISIIVTIFFVIINLFLYCQSRMIYLSPMLAHFFKEFKKVKFVMGIAHETSYVYDDFCKPISIYGKNIKMSLKV